MTTTSRFRKPTPDEWSLIEPHFIEAGVFDDESIGVIHQVVANNEVTSHNHYLTLPTLQNFSMCLEGTDLRNKVNPAQPSPGVLQPVPLMLNHASGEEMLPLGSSFDSTLSPLKGQTNVLGDPLYELIGKFYVVQVGIQALSMGGPWDKNPVTLDMASLALKYNSGMIRGGSVGFRSAYRLCTICGAQGGSCDHTPGSMYKEGGATKMCLLAVGSPDLQQKTSDAILMEHSLVLRGAVARAGARRSGEAEAGEVTDRNSDVSLATGHHCFSYSNSNIRRNAPGKPCAAFTADTTDPATDAGEESHSLKVPPENTQETPEVRLGMALSSLAQAQTHLGEVQKSLELAESRAEKAELALTELEGTLPQLTSFRDEMLKACQESHVKALGQTPEEDLTSKYSAMTASDLFTAYSTNMDKFRTDTATNHKLGSLSDATPPTRNTEGLQGFSL